MKLPESIKLILYFLIAIIGLIILAAVTVNLPFAHRFITSKVNNILSNAHIPITINSIGTILPNSIVVNGITLSGIKGETIIYAEKAGVTVATLALIRKRVLITSVILSNPAINLSRAEKDLKINIAEAFSNKKSKVPEKRPARKNSGKFL